MHGIILAGGTGTRLDPLTKITNKHLLPVYDKQMIFYPLQTLMDAGITKITLVGGKGHVGQFLELLGSGYDMGIDLSYVIQEKPMGVAHGIWVALREIGKVPVFVILGDNVTTENFKQDMINFNKGAKVFLKQVTNPGAYGIAEIEDEKITKIIEKPTYPKSNYAVIGAYMYDEKAYDIIDGIEPSVRGEVEVTALNEKYRKLGQLDYRIINSYWKDLGTFEGIFKTASYVREQR